ncbi:hypothetical protein BGX38DRAFT_1185873 [Terfezia claveryi]|nr:hypothetical protein BGX38DRAFT_1185873 [Terfezia claveryi]
MQSIPGYVPPQQQYGMPPQKIPKPRRYQLQEEGYYQPGRNGAIEARSIQVTRPAPTSAPQIQAQASIYEL